MAKTETMRGVEAVRQELEDVEAAVREWEAELATLENLEPPSWEAANDPGELERYLEAERRKVQLPLQLRAGRIRAVELELELKDLELASAEEEVLAAHSAWEPVNEKLRRAQEAERRARGAWHDARYRVGDIRREKTAKERELHLLTNEPTPEQRGPVVRSPWQANFTPNPDDPGLGGDSPSTAFGAANVRDVPVSAQEDAGTGQPTAVIPQKALSDHAKSRKK